jgi:hypothetical protein
LYLRAEPNGDGFATALTVATGWTRQDVKEFAGLASGFNIQNNITISNAASASMVRKKDDG